MTKENTHAEVAQTLARRISALSERQLRILAAALDLADTLTKERISKMKEVVQSAAKENQY